MNLLFTGELGAWSSAYKSEFIWDIDGGVVGVELPIDVDIEGVWDSFKVVDDDESKDEKASFCNRAWEILQCSRGILTWCKSHISLSQISLALAQTCTPSDFSQYVYTDKNYWHTCAE